MSNAFDFNCTKKLGFGFMRIPGIQEDNIDYEKTCKLVDIFMERGFTYFDTAYVYGREGASEIALRKCLVERYPRDSFTVATKFPVMALDKLSPDQVEECFNTSLTRMGVDYVDYYLIHNFTPEKAEGVERFKLWDLVNQKKAEGKIRHIGFSSHAKPEFIDEVLTAHPETEFVQLQINYLDWEDAGVQAHACYDVVRKHGKPVVIMEPVKGGSLSGGNKEINAILKAYDKDASPASWALRFAAGLEGVGVVLSGMNEIEHVLENTTVLDNPRKISEEEQKVLDEVVKAYNSVKTVPCTACRYCIEGCPMGIEIPRIFRALNSYRRYGNLASAKQDYKRATEKGGLASACIGCRACEGVCPQRIAIPDILPEAAELFE